MCSSNPHIFNINVQFKVAYFWSLFTVQIPSALLVQKCTDLNRTLRPKVCGFDPYIRTTYRPDIPHILCVVATLHVKKITQPYYSN